MYQVRTDLALEAREKFEEDNVEIKGVRLDEEQVTKTGQRQWESRKGITSRWKPQI